MACTRRMDAAQNKAKPLQLAAMKKQISNYCLETSSELARRMRRRLLPHNKDSHFITAPLYHADILYSLVTRAYFTDLIGGPSRVSTGQEWTLTQRADLTALIPSRFLSAEFEEQGITTRVLCSADFPVKLRYNKRTQHLHMTFFAEATHDEDGTRVMSARPKRRPRAGASSAVHQVPSLFQVVGFCPQSALMWL
jgi:hypothetical protein